MNLAQKILACAALATLAAAPARAAEARLIRYGFTVRNTTAQVIPEACLLAYAPLLHDTIRTSHPFSTINDAGGDVLVFAFTNLPPYASKIVTVECPLAPAASSGSPLADAAPHLAPAPLLEFDRPEFNAIPTLAAETPLATARRAADWVCANVAPADYSGRARGALEALRTRRGDCTEMAYLFAALCRRHGVPARVVGGYVCPRNVVLCPGDYHDWAEFHDGGAWQAVDCSRRVFVTNTASYVAFRLHGSTDGPMRGFPRFRFEGEGLDVRMNEPGK